ncbi:putative DNA-binding domain-containing protein [Ferrovibrio sp.]|uniref:HvfC/BufC family peptide modification chaperone n=1 Tax=Ferrovibrio sp. TaxID=1917215 RepID=UPI003D11F2CD
MSAALHKLQADFTAALRDPDRPPPAAIRATSAAQCRAHFNIHRNNMHVSLAAVLEARFPVIRRLVGDEFFHAMALVFVRQLPPASPVLARYGKGFGAFLQDFAPVRDLPYLPDMAALEWARSEAYHAADAPAASIADLAALPETALPMARLRLHPALRLEVSDYPIVSLWQTNSHDAEVRPLGAEMPGETALVTRPLLDVLVMALPPGGAAFITAVQAGAGFAAAADAALDHGADLPSLLATLFDAGAITGIAAG